MLAKVWTCAVVGLEGELVQVEVDIARQGLVQFNIVGLPDAAVREAHERVRAAVRNGGMSFPTRRVTAQIRRQHRPWLDNREERLGAVQRSSRGVIDGLRRGV